MESTRLGSIVDVLTGLRSGRDSLTERTGTDMVAVASQMKGSKPNTASSFPFSSSCDDLRLGALTFLRSIFSGTCPHLLPSTHDQAIDLASTRSVPRPQPRPERSGIDRLRLPLAPPPSGLSYRERPSHLVCESHVHPLLLSSACVAYRLTEIDALDRTRLSAG
jgi:hypothetical protein